MKVGGKGGKRLPDTRCKSFFPKKLWCLCEVFTAAPYMVSLAMQMLFRPKVGQHDFVHKAILYSRSRTRVFDLLAESTDVHRFDVVFFSRKFFQLGQLVVC